jgi:glycosyltransferase involved in cell wall biosynthesis
LGYRSTDGGNNHDVRRQLTMTTATAGHAERPARAIPPAKAGLSIVVPMFNEAAGLARLHDSLIDVARELRKTRGLTTEVVYVDDGSRDNSLALANGLSAEVLDVQVVALSRNFGKEAALMAGLDHARLGAVLFMDADGQHPPALIPEFIAASQAAPDALVLGVPVFDASAPTVRVRGRKVSNWWANLETLWSGIGDSLFGFRVYPIAPLERVMARTPWMRRFDFDVEAAVKLVWAGLRPINRPAPVRYLRPEEGGVSHFRYVRDNLLLSWMHLRLMLGFLIRLPRLLARRIIAP